MNRRSFISGLIRVGAFVAFDPHRVIFDMGRNLFLPDTAALYAANGETYVLMFGDTVSVTQTPLSIFAQLDKNIHEIVIEYERHPERYPNIIPTYARK